jgi:hypothetical protein
MQSDRAESTRKGVTHDGHGNIVESKSAIKRASRASQTTICSTVVRQLEEENMRLRKALYLCAARAGIPDPLEACRLIIQTAQEALRVR